MCSISRVPQRTLVVGDCDQQQSQRDSPEVQLLDYPIKEWQWLHKTVGRICDRRHKGRIVDLHVKGYRPRARIEIVLRLDGEFVEL